MSSQGLEAISVVVPERGGFSHSLQAGQILRGDVERDQTGLVLRLGSFRVCLREPSPLVAGQRVTVEVASAGKTVELRVTPQEAATLEGPPSRAEALAALVQRVLKPLSEVRLLESAAPLIPQGAPLTEQAVRLMLSLFMSRRLLGDDLRRIQQVLTHAGEDGAFEGSAAADIRGDIAQLLEVAPDRLHEWIVLWGRRAASATEARLADAAAHEKAGEIQGMAAEALRTRLWRLLRDDRLVAHLRARGQLTEFREVVLRAIDRLTAGHLQNARNLDLPYVFIELPGSTDGPFQRAQIHFFGEGRGGRRGIPAKHASVALDVSTAALGDLWIVLQIQRDRCVCRFYATTPQVVQAIEKQADRLVQTLATVGYARVVVQAKLWDGDRLGRVVELMRRFSGIDVTA